MFSEASPTAFSLMSQRLYDIFNLREGKDLFGDIDKYYPVQVKQMDKVGRPDIDKFYSEIKRDGRNKGYFVSFAYSKDAWEEVKRL